MTRSLTSTCAVLGLAGLVSGCSNSIPPVDVAGVRLVLVCLLNCPVSVTMADEGQATDAIPLEYPKVSPEGLRAARE